MKKFTKLKDRAYQNLPDFIKADYSTFITFLQAYYEFLDNQKLTRNLDYVRNIDDTLPEFLEQIRKEIGIIAPKLAEDNLFLKNSKDVYVSRGSEESYKLLFRLLYNKNVDIEYPRDNILKPSDGIWIQDNSIFVKLIDGDISSIENQYFHVKTVIKNVEQSIKLFCSKINKTKIDDVYEVFFDRKYYGEIKINDVIESDNLVAIVQPTLTNFIVKTKGEGFKLGQIFNIDTLNGSGTSIKVSKIGSNGEIERVTIVSHGVGYTTDFTYSIKKNIPTNSNILVNLPNIKINDNTNYNSDFGSIVKNDYTTDDYSDGDFSGTVLGTFSDLSSSEEDVATLICKVGAINKYQGYYATTRGLLSYDAFIQDGNYYQDFSYVLKIDEALDSYKKAVLDFLHPVGRKLFGNYLIESDIELFYEISNPILNILIPLFSESDESFYVFDGVISDVEIKNYIGDSTTSTFEYSIAPSKVLVSVKINQQTQTLGVDFEIVDNNVVFFFNPFLGDKIELRTAIINYSSSPLNQEVIIDFEKGKFNSATISSTKSVVKLIGKKISQDEITEDDFDYFDMIKNTSDFVLTPSEHFFFDMIKNASSSTSALDSASYYSLSKNSLENITTNENTFYNMNRTYGDFISMDEVLGKHLTKDTFFDFIGDLSDFIDIVPIFFFEDTFFDFIGDLSDFIDIVPNFFFEDTFGYSDNLLPYIFDKKIDDFVNTEDKFSIEDSDMFILNKNMSDVVEFDDYQSMIFYKSRDENLSSNDVLSKNWSTQLFEFAVSSDIYNHIVTKNLSEIILGNDTISKTITKPPINEFAGNSDSYDLLFIKKQNEIIVPSENIINKVINKDANESINGADSGEVVKSPYIIYGSTYFAEDYMNVDRRTF